MSERVTATRPVVELRGIELHLPSRAGEVNILRGVDLTVHAGESVCIVGPSGAGKSTMMMIIAGLERPSAGVVRVAGQELGGLGEDALALFRQRHVGIVFQAFRLIPTMTALENVALPLELAAAGDAEARAARSLRAVGLGHRLEHYPDQLSGGEQQRVALARSVVVEPALLLADEPTGNLDGVTGEAVIDLLFDLQARLGSSLVLITHDRALAARCDRTISMANGLLEQSAA